MARKEEFFFNSASGTTKIHAVRYLPDGEIKAILQISHGMVEHPARYDDLAKYLNSNDINVYGIYHI